MKSLLGFCSLAWLSRSHSWSFASLGAKRPLELPQTEASSAASNSIHHVSHTSAAMDRRNWFQSVATAGLILAIPSQRTNAQDLADAVQAIPFKEFNDAMFSIRLPKSYFAIRRSAKGDLPDSNTGQGRRGATIFTGGDMQKAELIAIERYPVRSLLEENGIEAKGKLDTFPDLGEPHAIANLISLHREKDRAGGGTKTALVPESTVVSSDGKDLLFQLKTEIEVQKPELLMEQFGVSSLVRVTNAKATLKSNDGNLMVVFGSALEQDFNGPDGQAIMETVKSFQAMDLSSTLAAT